MGNADSLHGDIGLKRRLADQDAKKCQTERNNNPSHFAEGKNPKCDEERE
jgi:hypothetical protein